VRKVKKASGVLLELSVQWVLQALWVCKDLKGIEERWVRRVLLVRAVVVVPARALLLDTNLEFW